MMTMRIVQVATLKVSALVVIVVVVIEIWILVVITTVTITTEHGIVSSVIATTPQESSNTINTINHLLNQIQTWQQSHFEQQQQQVLNHHDDKVRRHGHQPNRPPPPHQLRPLRPFVTATFAQSIDGYMSPFVQQQNEMSTATASTNCNNTQHTNATHSNYPLSSHESFVLTHGLRSIHDGILIGGRTLLLDNPRLTNRLWGSRNLDTINPTPQQRLPQQQQQPQPIIIDPNLRYVTQLLHATNGNMNVRHPIVCCTNDAASSHHQLHDSFHCTEPHGLYFRNHRTNNTIRLLPCQYYHNNDQSQSDNNSSTTFGFNMTDVFHQLYHRYQIRSIMVEGGAHTLSTLLTTTSTTQRAPVDAMVITIAPQLFGNGIRPRLRSSIDLRKDANHLDSWRLLPSSTSFVLLGNDATFIAQCDRSEI